MPEQSFWLEVGPFHIVPVCHHRMEFAREVERAFRVVRPRRVAIELAPFLLEPMQRAVRRFPRLTTLAYEVAVPNQLHHLLAVEPTDAFAEAVIPHTTRFPCRPA